MGFFFPDQPPQPFIPNQPPNQGQHSPVSPDAAPWFQLDQAVHGMADAHTQARQQEERARRAMQGLPPTPPGEYRPR
jgi:hypothetical protein